MFKYTKKIFFCFLQDNGQKKTSHSLSVLKQLIRHSPLWQLRSCWIGHHVRVPGHHRWYWLRNIAQDWWQRTVLVRCKFGNVGLWWCLHSTLLYPPRWVNIDRPHISWCPRTVISESFTCLPHTLWSTWVVGILAIVLVNGYSMKWLEDHHRCHFRGCHLHVLMAGFHGNGRVLVVLSSL